MNTKFSPRARWFLFTVVPLLCGVVLPAQTAADKPKEEEVFVMSPFTVQTSKDVGYDAWLS